MSSRPTAIILFLVWLFIFLQSVPAAAADEAKLQTSVETLTTKDLFNIEGYNETLSRYIDYANGYSLCVPNDMVIDYSQAAIRTVFANDTTEIAVYYDNFTDTPATTNDYVYYSNKFLSNTKDHTVLADEKFRYNGWNVHLLKWMRRNLSRIENDKNYYTSLEICKNTNEVYTILIKSREPIYYENDLLESFSLVERRGSAPITKVNQPSRTRMNAETLAFYHSFFGENTPLRWGIFEPSAPEDFTQLMELEDSLDYKFSVVLRYQSLDEQLPIQGLNNAYTQGKYVELTLQTVHADDVNALLISDYKHDNARTVYDILDGKYDDYLNEYARGLKAFSHPVLFRLNNEMNGDWCWYSAFYTAKDAELYKELWRYINTIFENNGVDNVIWVWNPHDVSRPDFKWNHYLLYYPGDEYVDVIGITGYNTGTYFIGETWREFADIYQPVYHEYASLFNKPFIITEFGSNSVGGDKCAWLTRMFTEIPSLPNIKIAIWWNGIDYDQTGNPGRIYQLDESDETLAAFRVGLHNSVKIEDVR